MCAFSIDKPMQQSLPMQLPMSKLRSCPVDLPCVSVSLSAYRTSSTTPTTGTKAYTLGNGVVSSDRRSKKHGLVWNTPFGTMQSGDGCMAGWCQKIQGCSSSLESLSSVDVTLGGDTSKTMATWFKLGDDLIQTTPKPIIGFGKSLPG